MWTPASEFGAIMSRATSTASCWMMRILLGPDSSMRLSRSEEHTSELQSLMRISYAVFCLKKKKKTMTRNKYSPVSTTLTTATTNSSLTVHDTQQTDPTIQCFE